MADFESNRNFLKAERWDEWGASDTDQKKKLPPPPVEKPCAPDTPRIDLIPPQDLAVGAMSLIDAMGRRKSHRKYTDEALTLEELSFLLWATQGVRSILGKGTTTRRTVPSGGSRHPFESYLLINNVTGVGPGLYRYLPVTHQLCFIRSGGDMQPRIGAACNGQTFVGKGAVAFIWTAIPYRAEWRYSFVAHKMIAMDAGHLCQNLYLACAAIGAGTCAIGAYNQKKLDDLIGVDGTDEFVIYIAPVGKVK